MSAEEGEWQDVECDVCANDQFTISIQEQSDGSVIQLFTCTRCLNQEEATVG